MGLTIVTGPANAAKAAVVLDRCRAASARSPILVVPRAADAEHYRRELAVAGAVIGPSVLPFGGLVREIARRAGVAGRPLGAAARERVLARVVAGSELEVLAPAARGPGFVPSLAQFVAELEARRVEPARLRGALRAWAPRPGSPRRRYAEELATLYGGYREALRSLRRLDAELWTVAAIDALRLAPERWGRTPVFCYGFDDLEPLQLDAVETLAHRVGAQVVLSLPGERGRVALAGRAATLETLRPGADEVVELPPLDAWYEAPALHHLERSLFEDAPRRVPAGDAVRLLEGGDERAEADLVAAEIVALIDGGCSPAEIAVVTRGRQRVATLIARALDAAAVPRAADRRERFADTAIGGGLLALLRIAAGHGGAADLVRWLRVPGLVERTAFVDELEGALLRRGISELAPARERWEGERWPLGAIERIGTAARAHPTVLLERVDAELDAMLAAPVRRRAAPLDPDQVAAVTAARRALADRRELAGAGRGYAPDAAAVAAVLGDLVVEHPPALDRDAVLICDALALRARRVRALFIAGVQEGVLPAPAREPAFLSGAERAELAAASGLVLDPPLDALAAERSLFYALCSRPTAWLRVSWHDGTDDDAGAALRSLFVDDLADCFDAALDDARVVRGAGVVAWAGAPPAPAPLAPLEDALAAPRRRGPVIGPRAAPALLEALRGHPAHSPSALESWASCPVAWFVERGLRLEALEPDSVPLIRGSVAHDAMRAVFAELRERSETGRLDASTLPCALAALERTLAGASARLSPRPAVARAEHLRLHSDLRRYLEFAAAAPGPFAPAALELAFGLPDDDLPAVALPGVELCGRVDRVDVDGSAGQAIVIDYKTGSVDAVARWAGERRLQPALYMLAIERLLGVEAVAGLYQPLRAPDLRPRGVAREDIDAGVPLFENDRLDAGALRAVLDGRLAVAADAARELAEGALAPRPQSCMRGGRCRHPSICRCEGR